MENLLIKKDNQIVQKTLNKFSYKQNQLMAILLGRYVNLNTDECINTSVSIEDIRIVLGIKSDGGNVYERLRNAIERFGENGSVGIYFEEKGKAKWRWLPYFTKIELSENNVDFEWNPHMKPYLINLKKNYTQYLSNDYLKLHSVYSQNLYELLKSLENYESYYKTKPQTSIVDLRNTLQVNGKKTYTQFKRLNDLILKKAVAEINDVTDLNVVYSTIKNGRTVIAVEWNIKRKEIHQPTKREKLQFKELTGNDIPVEATKKGDPDLLAQLQAMQKKYQES